MLSCGDSPLSITWNVIGILTLVYIVAMTLILHISRIQDAGARFTVLVETATSMMEHVTLIEGSLAATGKLSPEYEDPVLGRMRNSQLARRNLGYWLEKTRTKFKITKWSAFSRRRFVAKKAALEEVLHRFTTATRHLTEIQDLVTIRLAWLRSFLVSARFKQVSISLANLK